MSWKNWPYWMKGGTIGIVVGILVSLPPAIFLHYKLVSHYPFGLLLINFMLISVPFGILIGVIISQIYSKIKEKIK